MLAGEELAYYFTPQHLAADLSRIDVHMPLYARPALQF